MAPSHLILLASSGVLTPLAQQWPFQVVTFQRPVIAYLIWIVAEFPALYRWEGRLILFDAMTVGQQSSTATQSFTNRLTAGPTAHCLQEV